MVYAVGIGIIGAIVGALSGTRWKVIVSSLNVGVIGWIVVYAMWDPSEDPVLAGTLLGLPPGALVGAIIGVFIQKPGRKA